MMYLEKITRLLSKPDSLEKIVKEMRLLHKCDRYGFVTTELANDWADRIDALDAPEREG